MRIGVVTTSYPREPGDPAGAFVAGLAHWLARRGDHVEVIAAGPGRERDGDVPVHRVAAGSSLFYGEGAPDRLERSPRAWRDAPVFAAALAGAVARAARGWDAVISHWIVPCGVVAATVTRAPHLAIAHSGDVHLAARRGVADAVATALLASGRTRLAFVGAHLRARMLRAIALAPLGRALEARSIVSPMGIDVASLRAARRGDREASRRHLGIDRGPIVAALARLVPIKGVDVLVEALARLPRAPRRPVLLVGGDGPARPELERLAAKLGVDARFPGELRGKARDALICAADLLVVPSVDLPGGRTEGTPTVVLEALAAALPLVASEVGGARDVARGAALLVPPGDPDALSAAIARVLDDPAAAAARAAQGSAAAERHDWDRVGPVLAAQIVRS